MWLFHTFANKRKTVAQYGKISTFIFILTMDEVPGGNLIAILNRIIRPEEICEDMHHYFLKKNRCFLTL